MRVVVVLATVLLSSCVSGYREFYQAAPGATPEVVAKKRSGLRPKEPVLAHAGGQPSDVVSAYTRQGYGLIGYSSFNSGHSESDSGAMAQGAKVGADLVVVVNSKYTGSVTTSLPLTTPTTSTSYTNGSATAFGPSGSATAYGQSTTTTYGSQTTYIPMTVQRYDFGALYFIKRHIVLGANWRDLNDDERKSLQSNKGVYVIAVVDGSPAYKADLLPGDVIVAIDGAPVYGTEACSEIVLCGGSLAASPSLPLYATWFRHNANEQVNRVIFYGTATFLVLNILIAQQL